MDFLSGNLAIRIERLLVQVAAAPAPCTEDQFGSHFIEKSRDEHLKESDEIGKQEEHGLVADPLQHPEHDEGSSVNDEPRRENGFDSPN